MKYNELADSGVKVSAITFGAWAIGGWMWGGADKDDALAAIHKALELGITTIDTAPVYGQGVSEEIVGQALKGKRHEAQILTKYGMRWDIERPGDFMASKDDKGHDLKIYKFAGKESVIYECEQSLKRLQTDYIDLYQIHWPDVSTPIDETMEAIDRLLQEGKIRASGVCNYSAEQMRIADQTVKQVTNQVPYSMVERKVEAEVVPYCLEHGRGILAYSPLQRGILTGKITDDYQFEEGDHRPNTLHFKPHNRTTINAFLQQIKPIADGYGVTLAQLVINWTIQQPAIAAALVGARNPEQVTENAKATDFMLTPDELSQINTLLADVKMVA
ncbi:aldo/keto reductase [Adhaeribacter pallidiroseus]|uniref:General stress protein n=1 Tax=Adhaeribacter pallidiroseus TaxID=2072847 RepID=A0A369QN51_9BACT|nr:aldo/keto reductase [Adhaeribacter pallidiroseus]RDC64687.1 General stress protein [Adhaeribacter pallidiroseus]